MKNNRVLFALIVLALCNPAFSQAATYTMSGVVSKTERQSSSSTGPAKELLGTKFVGTTWDVEKDFGPGIETVPVPNPELAEYAAEYAAWQVIERAKDAKYAAELTAYGTKYAAYLVALGAWKICPFACGSRPRAPTEPTRDAAAPEPVAPPATIDVKGGADASVSTSGKVGFDLNYKLTAGAVDAKVFFDVSAELPDSVEVGEEFVIATTSDFTMGEILLDGPTAEASIDAVLEADVRVSGEACAVICTDPVEDFKLVGIDQDVELIKVTPTEITYVDGLTPDGVKLTTPLLDDAIKLQGGVTAAGVPAVVLDGPFIPKPPGVYTDLAAFDFQVPVYSGVGGKDGDSLDVTGRSDYIDFSLDLDALFSATGLPTLGGLSTGVGPIGVSFDAWDIDGILSLDVFQDLELTPTLHVDFDFTKPVEILGATYTSFTSAWDSLPAFKIFEETTFLPKFFVKAVANTALGLQAGLELQIDFMKGSLSLSAFDKTLISLDIGPLYSKNFPFDLDFARFNLFESGEFDVGGFSLFAGTPFTLTPGSEPSIGVDPRDLAAVPLPAGGVMFVSGLAMLLLGRKRRRDRRLLFA